MIGGVLERIWAGFTSSYDVDEAIRGSGPRSTALAVSALCTALLLVAHLPACDSAHFDSPWVAVGFALLGGMETVFAWKHGCTGRWGSLATRLDNAFYVLALAWAAGNSSQTYGLFFTACLAAMLLGFQALTYGFGLPMVAAFAVPPAVVVWWTRPDTLVQLALLGTVLLSVLRLMLTSERLRVRRFANGAEPLLRA